MQIPESITRFCQNASNALSSFAKGAKEQFVKAGTYIGEVAAKVSAAVAPHFEKFKNATVTFVRENKVNILVGAICLAIGAAIAAAIACLCKSKPSGSKPIGTVATLPPFDQQPTPPPIPAVTSG
jgi:hypothetical protein